MESDPRVSAQIGGSHYEVTAEKLTEAERSVVWDRLVEEVPNFGLYEHSSGRALRVFRQCLRVQRPSPVRFSSLSMPVSSSPGKPQLFLPLGNTNEEASNDRGWDTGRDVQ